MANKDLASYAQHKPKEVKCKLGGAVNVFPFQTRRLLSFDSQFDSRLKKPPKRERSKASSATCGCDFLSGRVRALHEHASVPSGEACPRYVL
jgi:hypothetical protein